MLFNKVFQNKYRQLFLEIGTQPRDVIVALSIDLSFRVLNNIVVGVLQRGAHMIYTKKWRGGSTLQVLGTGH